MLARVAVMLVLSWATVSVAQDSKVAGGDPLPVGVVSREFIYETAPFPQCHASTIEATKSGLVCAWFGGTKEKHPDVGVWFSRHDGKAWSAPVELANGV